MQPEATMIGTDEQAIQRPTLWQRLTSKRVLAGVALAIGIGCLIRYGQVPAWMTPQAIRTTVAGFGMWGPLIYTAIKILAMVLLVVVPIAPIAVVAGVLYGVVWGTLLNLVTTLLGAVITFAIGRRLGQDAVQKRLKGRMKGLDKGFGANGLLYITLARMAPVLPISVVSYLASVSSMSWRDYVIGTAIGIIPTSIMYSYVGAAASEASPQKLLIALGFKGLLILLAIQLRRRHAQTQG